MIKWDKNVLKILLIQSTLAIAIGFLALFIITGKGTSSHIQVGALSLDGVNRDGFEDALKKHYEVILKDGFFIIRYNGDKDYKMKLSDLDAKMEYNVMSEEVFSNKLGKRFVNIITEYFQSSGKKVTPKIKLNASKLKERLTELAAIINKEPVNANIYLKDGKIFKVSEANGVRLDVDSLSRMLESEIGFYLEKPYTLEAESRDLVVTFPQITLKEFEGVEEIISTYSSDIKDQNEKDAIALAIDSINKVIVYPADKGKNEEPGEFSFNKYLSLKKGIIEKNNEGYNQVASTLYAALLIAGIRHEDITRSPHKTTVEYIDPGLDAVIFGQTVDFKFKNTLTHPVVIFTEVKDNKVIVSLAGKKQEGLNKTSLKVELEQKYIPPIIHVQNDYLEPGKTKVVSPGQEGVKVKVYKVTMADSMEINKDFLYTDEYKAVEAMVEIGPDTRWNVPIIK
ncbi:MAG: hypothetical protein K0R31_1996 [Clostridiales bacterium]|nr:hypothetical protein [Clostridiales bacterium]